MTKEMFDFEQRAEGQEMFLFSSVWTMFGAQPSFSVGASVSFSHGKVAECGAILPLPQGAFRACMWTTLPVPYHIFGLS